MIKIFKNNASLTKILENEKSEVKDFEEILKFDYADAITDIIIKNIFEEDVIDSNDENETLSKNFF